MYFVMELSISEIAQFLGGTIVGQGDLTINKVCKIQVAMPGSIAFLANPKYEKHLYTTQASAVIINKDFRPARRVVPTLILVEDPYESFSTLLAKYQAAASTKKGGVEYPSYLGKQTTLGKGVYRGAFSYIGDHAQLGEGVQVYPHAYIGDHVSIGDDTLIYAGAKIYAGSQIGRHCTIHAGAVIGSDGFGFAPQADSSYQKIPQLGYVVLEDYVEIGANTTIDRATLGSTWIKEGTKIDNLVQVAHNVEIGEHTVIAALSGIAGSAKLGAGCMLGGQVGVAGHTEVGSRTTVAGQGGVTKSYKQGETTLMGMPAFDRKQYLRSYVAFKQLPELAQKVRQLAEEMAYWKAQLPKP